MLVQQLKPEEPARCSRSCGPRSVCGDSEPEAVLVCSDAAVIQKIKSLRHVTFCSAASSIQQHMSKEMKHGSWQLRGSAAGADARQYLHKAPLGNSVIVTLTPPITASAPGLGGMVFAVIQKLQNLLMLLPSGENNELLKQKNNNFSLWDDERVTPTVSSAWQRSESVQIHKKYLLFMFTGVFFKLLLCFRSTWVYLPTTQTHRLRLRCAHFTITGFYKPRSLTKICEPERSEAEMRSGLRVVAADTEKETNGGFEANIWTISSQHQLSVTLTYGLDSCCCLTVELQWSWLKPSVAAALIFCSL